MFTRGYTRNDMNHFWGYNNWIEQRNYATKMSFVKDDPNHHWMILKKVRCAGVNKPCASWITFFQVTSRGKTPLICLITLSQLQPRFHGSISLCLPFLSQFLHVQSHISWFQSEHVVMLCASSNSFRIPTCYSSGPIAWSRDDWKHSERYKK